MKPKFKQNAIIFYPSGFLDGDISKYEISKTDRDLIYSKKFSCILISLKKVVHFNKRGLNALLDVLGQISLQISAHIAFCDYDEVKFAAIKNMHSSELNFSLFDTLDIALLFFDTAHTDNKDKQILLFHEDQKQKNKIALMLSQCGYSLYIAKNLDEFRALKDKFEHKICLTLLNIGEQKVATIVKENVVIYELSGFIDSNLAQNFDIQAHANSLKNGFKFFAFDATKAKSANIHGVSLLAKLSVLSAEYGATIAVCGLSEDTSQTLRHDLEDSGILLYKSVNDFFNDDGSIEGGAGLAENKPQNITKKLIEFLPSILQISADTLSAITRLEIKRGEVSVRKFNLAENVMAGCVAFYGDVEAKILLCLDKNIAKNACKVLINGDESVSLNDAYANLISVVADKILAFFRAKNINLNTTMPNVFDDETDYQDSGKGVFVELAVGGAKGALFLSR